MNERDLVPNIYVIRCTATNADGFYIALGDYGRYWSNDWGWGSLEGCAQYSFAATQVVRLPIGGKWVDLRWAQEEKAARESEILDRVGERW